MRRVALVGVAMAVVAAGVAVPAHSRSRAAAAPVPVTDARTGVTDLGPLPDSEQVSVLLSLQDTASASRAAMAAAASDPASGSYGRYLPQDAVWSGYGPSSATVAPVLAELTAAGLAPEWSAGASYVTARGPVRAVEKSFGVQVHAFRASTGQTWYADLAPGTVPTQLSGAVSEVGRVSSLPHRSASFPALAPAGGLRPDDLLNAYNLLPLRDAGFDGTGQTVTIVVFDDYDQADLDRFTQDFGLPPVEPERIEISKPTESVGEATMDIAVVHAIAPGAKIKVYLENDGRTVDLLQASRRAFEENPGSIQTNSFGGCELGGGGSYLRALQDVADRAAATGSTWFASSGDQGGTECKAPGDESPPSDDDIGVSLPAAAPGITSVGGTRVGVDPQGNWLGEAAWHEPARHTGSGGGVSTLSERPDWQDAPGTDQVEGQGQRVVPDVSASASNASGLAFYFNGEKVQGGGTSQSSPIWAGMTALFNQYLEQEGGSKVGFFNPALYQLARDQQEFPPFHDVSTGSNLIYPTGPGYDLVTGLGTPDGWNLVRDLRSLQRKGKK